jgi:hypothetical protein
MNLLPFFGVKQARIVLNLVLKFQKAFTQSRLAIDVLNHWDTPLRVR